MAIRLLRVVYAIEFLVALIALLSLWREVGGQYHLDLMPWYAKLILPVGLAAAVVQTTVAAVAEKRRKFIIWAAVIVILVLMGGLVTFYYHLNEPLEEDPEAATLSALLNRKALKLPITSLL